MPSDPELVELNAVPTAVVRDVVPMAELTDFFDRGFTLLGTTLSEQGIEPDGAGFALYHGQPGETADLEIGYRTTEPVRPTDGVAASELPAGRVARVVHAGGFDDLPAAWAGLERWIDDQGLTSGDVFWEVYLIEPTPDLDPADLRTELNWPVTD